MRNQEEALARIVRHLNGQRIEEVADRILALFNEPPWWKSEDKHAVYTVSEGGEIRATTFRHGESRSEALGPLAIASRARRTPHVLVMLLSTS
jgi:hypothetical protein